jgi:hypothetical protein
MPLWRLFEHGYYWLLHPDFAITVTSGMTIVIVICNMVAGSELLDLAFTAMTFH